MNVITARETVVLIRELRDGTITEERLERWLAELLIGCIPSEEPLVAKARITRLPIDTFRQHTYRATRGNRDRAYVLALQLAQISGGLDVLPAPGRIVA